MSSQVHTSILCSCSSNIYIQYIVIQFQSFQKRLQKIMLQRIDYVVSHLSSSWRSRLWAGDFNIVWVSNPSEFSTKCPHLAHQSSWPMQHNYIMPSNTLPCSTAKNASSNPRPATKIREWVSLSPCSCTPRSQTARRNSESSTFGLCAVSDLDVVMMMPSAALLQARCELCPESIPSHLLTLKCTLW